MLAGALRRLLTPGIDPAEVSRALEEHHTGRALVTRSDQLVYRELDPLTEVYLLTEGTVRLFVGEGANRRTTMLLGAPALFGDRDLLAGCAASQESARSISTTRLLCYDQSALLEAWSELRDALTRDLLLRSARTIRFASYLAQPLEARVIALLREHHPSGAGELPPYETLALMTDAAEKSIGRAIRTLQERGQLVLDGRRGFRLAEDDEAQEQLGLIHRFTAGSPG